MPFAFTFSVPTLYNPFAPSVADIDSLAAVDHIADSGPATARAPPADPTTEPRVSRKRGWLPANSAPSEAVTSLTTSETAYLDTPSKYVHEAEAMAARATMASKQRYRSEDRDDDTAGESLLVASARGYCSGVRICISGSRTGPVMIQ